MLATVIRSQPSCCCLQQDANVHNRSALEQISKVPRRFESSRLSWIATFFQTLRQLVCRFKEILGAWSKCECDTFKPRFWLLDLGWLVGCFVFVFLSRQPGRCVPRGGRRHEQCLQTGRHSGHLIGRHPRHRPAGRSHRRWVFSPSQLQPWVEEWGLKITHFPFFPLLPPSLSWFRFYSEAAHLRCPSWHHLLWGQHLLGGESETPGLFLKRICPSNQDAALCPFPACEKKRLFFCLFLSITCNRQLRWGPLLKGLLSWSQVPGEEESHEAQLTAVRTEESEKLNS